MNVEKIFAKLDEIRALVVSNSGPDRREKIDTERVYVATEF